MLKFLIRTRLLQFFAVGSAGALLNIAVTWACTTYIFGLQNYFAAYLFGLAANLIFNFSLYSVSTFRTRRHHARRALVYIAWSVAMTALQAWVVHSLVPMVGLRYYLFVIAGVIFFFAIVNFFVFKFSIFKEREEI